MDLLGFWSYVHADDEVDGGRVTQLGRDAVAHFEAITAESIELFLDRDGLHWGDQWREEIDEALSNVAFFIPVMTPRYFKRPECRRELQFFVGRAENLGINELILPILYIDVPELLQENPSDPLVEMAKKIQWVDWTEHRFEERSSGAYRKAVNSLAQELARRMKIVESVDVAGAMAANASAEDDGEAGTLDKIAALEEAMPKWTESLEEITLEIQTIGSIMEQATIAMEKADKQGKSAAGRLFVARHTAQELEDPVDKIESLGQKFAMELAEIDAGVRTLLEEGAKQVREEGEPEGLRQYCEFVASIHGLAGSSREGLGSIEGMVLAIQPIERMSKDMRRPLRRLRASLTAMTEAREITAAWVDLADHLDVQCPDVASALGLN